MPYNGLETQRLFRQVENGVFRNLPGAELVDALYKQLKEAHTLIGQQSAIIQAGAQSGRMAPDPSLTPQAFTPARIMPSEHNPLGLTNEGTDSRAIPPPPLTPQRQLVQPRAGEVFNPFMAASGVEAPPPVPFSQTAGPDVASSPPPPAPPAPVIHLQPAPGPAKPGRKIRLK